MIALKGALLVLVIGALALLTPSVYADGAWLDQQPPVQWNRPRMQIPAAPPVDAGVDPRCFEQQRPPETDEDEELVRAGWHLIGSYGGGWGMLVIRAGSSYDGMCRPWGYQYFVFQNGLFAGAVSPEVMNSRTDGAATEFFLTGPDSLNVTFLRYADTDPLCCPSRTSDATYRIVRSMGAPVLTISNVSTSPTQ